MTWETLKLFWRATWRYKRLLFVSETSAVAWTLAGDIFPPLVISRVIDKLSSSDLATVSIEEFYGYFAVFIGLQIVFFLAGRGMMQSFIRLEPKVVRDLENTCFAKFQNHSLAFFADNFSGALVAKVNRLTSAYQRIIELALGRFGDLFRRYSASIIIIAFVSPLIAGIFIIWTVIFCISLVYLHKRKIKHSRAAASAQTNVTARLADIISNTLTIRSFAHSRGETKHFHALTQKRSDLRFRNQQVGEYIRIYKTITMLILNVAVLWFSVKLALNGSVSVGSVVLIQIYLMQLLRQLWDFGKYMDQTEESLADASEMTEIIMQPHDVLDPAKPEKPRISKGIIKFEDVTFHYSDNSRTLFKNLNVNIPAGQKVGLVGPSGGGKTTLTKLLLRFMDIDNGKILIDGQDVKNITQEDLRRSIAYVPQEPLLFHRSIYENIAYGNTNASEKAVIKAAKRAQADEFIAELPNKFSTLVGERGVKLSGGQRQRIAIARAMLKEAPIIVLDEATSSLDSASEKSINAALDQLMNKRTTLVIAHRLSTIHKLDRILVMESGKIVEDGTHKELLKQKGLYATLWSHQSGDFIGQY